MTANDRLSRVQHRAVTALLAARTIEDAATVAGCSERTLRRWLSYEPFATAYRAAAREAHRDAVSTLLAAQGEAVAALRDALRTGTPTLRVRAARTLLEVGIRVSDVDMDERLAKIEEEVARWLGDDGTPRFDSVP